MKKIFIFCLFLFSLFHLSAQEIKNWKLGWDPMRGIILNYNETPFNFGSQFMCVQPDFKAHWFYPPKSAHKVAKTANSITVKSETSVATPFFLEENSLVVNSPSEFTLTAKGILRQAVPATVQHVVLFLPEALMAGATVESDGKTYNIGKDTINIHKLSKSFIIKSPMGIISLKIEKGPSAVMQDRREKPYVGNKGFIFLSTSKLAQNDTFEQIVKFSVSDLQLKTSLPAYSAQPDNGFSIVPSIQTTTFATAKDTIYPLPKNVEWGNGHLNFPTEQKVSIKGAAKVDEKLLLMALSKAFAHSGANSGFTINSYNPFVEISVDRTWGDKNKFDRYELTVDDKVRITTATPAGAYYALQTLSQLVSELGIRRAAIKDNADFKTRAVQVILDNHALELLLPLIEEVYAPLKINHLFVFCQDLEWPSFPELHHPKMMTQLQLAKLLEICNANYITVSPLIETYGHMEWMLSNPKYRDLAEDPDKPFAYNVSNPKTFETMTKLFDDVLTLFPNSTYLHVGHDEIANRGRYPFRENNKLIPAWRLYLKNLQFCEDYAKRKNVKLMVWQDKPIRGDMSASIFSRAWQDFSQDTAVAVWDYTASRDFPDANYFKKQGNPVFGATGMDVPSEPEKNAIANISGFARYAKQLNLEGMIQTTWSGTKNNDKALFMFTDQYWLQGEAACAFWDANYMPQSYSSSQNSYTRTRFDAAVKRIVPETYTFNGSERLAYIDISKSLNAYLIKSGMEKEWIPGEITCSNGGAFRIAGNNSRPLAVVIDTNKPLTIDIDKPAKAISLLWASINAKPAMSNIGAITIEGRFGKKVLPVCVGKEILCSGENVKSPATVHLLPSRNGILNLSQYTFNVPDNLKSFTISADDKTAIALVAATIIEATK